MTSRTRLKSSKKIADYASLFPLLSLLFWLYLKFTHQQNIIISICIYFFEQMLLILNPASKISARSVSDKKELLISTYSPGIVKPTISFCIQYLTHLCALRRLKMISLYSYLFDYITKHVQPYAPPSGIPPKSTLIHNSPQMTKGLPLITLP